MNLEVLAQKLSDHIGYEEKRALDKDKMDKIFLDKLDGIIRRQDYTNGSVTNLQKENAEKNGLLKGMAMAGSALGFIVIGLVAYIWTTHLK